MKVEFEVEQDQHVALGSSFAAAVATMKKHLGVRYSPDSCERRAVLDVRCCICGKRATFLGETENLARQRLSEAWALFNDESKPVCGACRVRGQSQAPESPICPEFAHDLLSRGFCTAGKIDEKSK